ncbi:MAG: hypothetical protein RL071_928 [Pseudomonadota bacterium]
MAAQPPDKVCAACGRSFSYRAKWARDWEAVRYCSARCRGARPAADDPLERAILDALAARAREATVCPSEIAQARWEDWRPHLEEVRCAARRLVAVGQIELTQAGAVVDPDHARGPLRMRRGPRFPPPPRAG